MGEREGFHHGGTEGMEVRRGLAGVRSRRMGATGGLGHG